MFLDFILFYTFSLFVASLFSENSGIICAILSGAYMVAKAIYDVNDEDDDD